MWIINNDKVCVGFVFYQFDERDEIEIGAAIYPPWRNLGLASGTIPILLDLIQTRHPNTLVYSRIIEGNIPSEKIVTKLGFLPKSNQPDKYGFIQYDYPSK
jgi:RimJ/RimL family protein N-acetyltransferase